MDVDPVDGGPKPPTTAPLSPTVAPIWTQTPAAAAATTEEDARQCIEKLRGDVVSERVEAAHCLDRIATVLGEERTRRVSILADSECACSVGCMLSLSY